MHRPVLVEPPVELPVTLEEAKLHLRIEPELNLEDALITGLIAAATDHLDGWTGILGRCLVEQTWRQDFDNFTSCLPLPIGPAIEIVSAVAGDDTLDPSDYALKVDSGGRAYVMFGSWMSVNGPISITYKAGYLNMNGTPSKSTVPAAIKTAILLFVGAWYENREETAIGVSVSGLPNSVAAHALLGPYRRAGV